MWMMWNDISRRFITSSADLMIGWWHLPSLLGDEASFERVTVRWYLRPEQVAGPHSWSLLTTEVFCLPTLLSLVRFFFRLLLALNISYLEHFWKADTLSGNIKRKLLFASWTIANRQSKTGLFLSHTYLTGVRIYLDLLYDKKPLYRRLSYLHHRCLDLAKSLYNLKPGPLKSEREENITEYV